MTCPDWSALTAHRFAAPETAAAEEPRGWREALDHLAGCPGCRRRALAADPTLAFRGLPGPSVGPAEVDEIRAGVAALRRTRRLETATARTGRAAGAGNDERDRSRPWFRAAAAAGLLLVLAGLGPALAPEHRADRQGGRTENSPAARTFAAEEAGPTALLDDPRLLTVDEIEHPTASVYHFDAEEVAVVMVVDAGFDV